MVLTAEQFNKAVEEAHAKWLADEDLSFNKCNIGIRFEDAEHEIGAELDWSKDNPDREDEREFPDYGTQEYDELPELDGTSVWYMGDNDDGRCRFDRLKGNETTTVFGRKHCYIVISRYIGHHDCPDEGEQLFKDATVFAKIF